MKKTLAILFLSFLTVGVYAQDGLSKKEKKKIKKELKQYKKNPETFVEKMDGFEDEIESLEEEVKDYNQTIADNNMSLTKAGDKIEELSGEILDLQNELAEKANLSDCGIMPEGTTYRVQIGLYEFFNLSADVQNEVRTLMLEEVNGQNRYSIGNFTTVQEAGQFKKEMMQMGIKDAFVSEYLNGDRNMDFDERDAK